MVLFPTPPSVKSSARHGISAQYIVVKLIKPCVIRVVVLTSDTQRGFLTCPKSHIWNSQDSKSDLLLLKFKFILVHHSSFVVISKVIFSIITVYFEMRPPIPPQEPHYTLYSLQMGTRTFPKGFWSVACPGGRKATQARSRQLAGSAAKQRPKSLGAWPGGGDQVLSAPRPAGWVCTHK